jgi:hypothetical protein
MAKGQGVDATGRSKKEARHLRLYRSVMETPAWRSLSPPARAVLIELYALYRGDNNGELFLACREAASRCNINKDTASKSFRELEDKGFIQRRARRPEKWTEGLARCWILTEFPFPRDGIRPTRDYLNWTPAPTKLASPETGQTVRKEGTKGGRRVENIVDLSEKRGQKPSKNQNRVP